MRNFDVRLKRLEQRARPDVVGIWDMEEDDTGDTIEVWGQGRHLAMVTMDAFQQQYPDGTLCKIVYGEQETAA